MWSLICLNCHCVQGLANESSNHSYGSLGSSSDKESEVKHTDICVCLDGAKEIEIKTDANNDARHNSTNSLALPTPLVTVSPTTSTSPCLLFLELWFEKRELPCLLSMFSFFLLCSFLLNTTSRIQLCWVKLERFMPFPLISYRFTDPGEEALGIVQGEEKESGHLFRE